jgi:NAD-specific glutamate dehydrogenase
MAKVNQQAQADKKAAKSDPGPKTVGEGERFAKLLLAGAAEEDIAPYDRGVLKEAASLAWHALKKHRSGASVVAVDNDHRMVRDGRPLTAVTVVNDNMPFLFDSVLGEIADSAGSPTLVTHPIIAVRHGRGGVSGLAEGLKDKSADKVSVIHVHVARLGDEAAAALEKRLERILPRCAPPSMTGAPCWRALTRRSSTTAIPIRISTRTPSPRRSPSSNGCATTISPSSACANTATHRAPGAAAWSAPTSPASAYSAIRMCASCAAAARNSPPRPRSAPS